MEIFEKIVTALGKTPDWVPLALIPALLLASTLLFTLFGGRRAYPFVAAALAAAGFALFACLRPLSEAFVYLALFAALAALLRLPLFLPRATRRKACKKARAERIYERFREPLTSAEEETLPPKVCCFEEAPPVPAADAPEPSYALILLKKLQKQKLTPTDRLEADVLRRTAEGLQGRALTVEEAQTLNDCLASVLRMSAKYKL